MRQPKELQLLGNAARGAVLGASRMAHVTPLLNKARLPEKLAHPNGITYCTSRKGLLWIPLAKEFLLAGSRRRAFSSVAPILWNILVLERRSTSTPLSFWKSLKAWLCHQALGPTRSLLYWDSEDSHPRLPVILVFNF